MSATISRLDGGTNDIARRLLEDAFDRLHRHFVSGNQELADHFYDDKAFTPFIIDGVEIELHPHRFSVIMDSSHVESELNWVRFFEHDGFRPEPLPTSLFEAMQHIRKWLNDLELTCQVGPELAETIDKKTRLVKDAATAASYRYDNQCELIMLNRDPASHLVELDLCAEEVFQASSFRHDPSKGFMSYELAKVISMLPYYNEIVARSNGSGMDVNFWPPMTIVIDRILEPVEKLRVIGMAHRMRYELL